MRSLKKSKKQRSGSKDTPENCTPAALNLWHYSSFSHHKSHLCFIMAFERLAPLYHDCPVEKPEDHGVKQPHFDLVPQGKTHCPRCEAKCRENYYVIDSSSEEEDQENTLSSFLRSTSRTLFSLIGQFHSVNPIASDCDFVAFLVS